MMTDEQKDEIRSCIAFYDERGWDWSSIVEYLTRRYNEHLPWQEWTPPRYTRQRKEAKNDE